MSSWLSHAADLLARVAMNRLRLAFCSRASELAILGAVVSTCSRSIAGGAIWYPFSSMGYAQKPGGTRAHELSRLAQDAALACTLATQASRRPSPPARSPPQAPRAQGVRRPGPARGSERCGRLGATPGDAPVASTPPRRREPGR